MDRQLTCIVCPLGCSLKVTVCDNEVIAVEGNSCPRGEKYANEECTNPRRTVTSTMRCEDGTLVAVKTDRTIPKDKIFECMRIINTTDAPNKVRIGDILIKDVFGSNIIATQNK